MAKQTLSIEQMQHLQELGLELKETMLYWARCVDNNPRAATHYGKWVLIKGNNAQTVGLMHWEFIPAYTLQDVLGALPKMIYPFPVHKIGFELWIGGGKIFYANMFNLEDVLKVRYDKELIDAAYSMLCWAIENKFVETNKNE